MAERGVGPGALSLIDALLGVPGRLRRQLSVHGHLLRREKTVARLCVHVHGEHLPLVNRVPDISAAKRRGVTGAVHRLAVQTFHQIVGRGDQAFLGRGADVLRVQKCT